MFSLGKGASKFVQVKDFLVDHIHESESYDPEMCDALRTGKEYDWLKDPGFPIITELTAEQAKLPAADQARIE